MIISREIFVRLIIIIAIILCIASASSGTEPFEKTTVSLHGVLNINENQYHNYWKKARGIELQLETPFYLGLVESGVQVAGNNSRNEIQPDYWSAFVFLGWGMETEITGGLRWYGGIRTGNFYMNFDDTDIYPTLKSESELGLELKTSIRYSIADNISLVISGRYRTVYTYRRLHHSFISLGISKTFTTPRWLKEFLE